MYLFRYVCDECNLDFWSDVPEADYCCNCGSPKISDVTNIMGKDDIDYLKRMLEEVIEVFENEN